MVKIDTVVTRGGDTGFTSLGDGTRVAKSDIIVQALGSVDEANAAIGLLRLHVGTCVDAGLARIQNDLFDIGADMSVRNRDGLRIVQTVIDRIENEIAVINAALPKLTSFILPGGNAGSSYSHIARVVVRRTECVVVQVENINPLIQIYLNRLSDYLFVLGRILNSDTEILWVPGLNQ